MATWMSARGWIGRITLAFAALWCSAQAQAYTVTLTPPDQTVGLGAQFAVGLTAADLGTTGIGSYLLNVNFDSTILAFDHAVDGFSLGLDALGILVMADTGLVSVGDVAISDPLELLTRQGEGLTLFTLYFNAIDFGTSALSLSVSAFSDVFGTEVTPLVTSASVTVSNDTGTPVSAPGTLALSLAGVAAAALVRRRRGGTAATA